MIFATHGGEWEEEDEEEEDEEKEDTSRKPKFKASVKYERVLSYVRLHGANETPLLIIASGPLLSLSQIPLPPLFNFTLEYNGTLCIYP